MYEFKTTKLKGDIENVRKQCQAFGGDLITRNMGKEGQKYYKFVLFVAYV